MHAKNPQKSAAQAASDETLAKIVIVLLLLLLVNVHCLSARPGQVNIYTENFNSYSNNTAVSAKWTLSTGGCTLGTNQNYFDVQAKRLEARGINCEAVWRSSILDISGYADVDISMYLKETGSLESGDYLKVYYKLNGGNEILFATNGELINDFTSKQAIQNGLNGSTLQIVIRVNNNDVGEKHRIDNITVAGTQVSQQLSLTFQSAHVTCNGDSSGSIDMIIGNSTVLSAPYIFVWSNGRTTQNISNLSAGNYSVTVVANNGSTATGNVTITQPAAIAITPAATNANAPATDGAIDLSVSGGTSPYTYSWSTGASTQNISGLSPASYTVTVTDAAGCTATAMAVVSFTGNTKCICTGSGRWSTTASWWGNCHGGNGTYPNELDTAYISGFSVEANQSEKAKTIQLTGKPGAVTSLTVSGEARLNVVGDINITQPGGDVISLLIKQGADVVIGTDLLLNNSTTSVISVTVSDYGMLDINNDLHYNASQNNTTTVTAEENARLKLKGNLTRKPGNDKYGVLIMDNNAVLEFAGDSPQVLPGTAGAGTDSLQLRNVVIDNSSTQIPQLTLADNVYISTMLELKNGVVATSNYTLCLLNSAATALSGYSARSYIAGKLNRAIASDTSTYVFPVGYGEPDEYHWVKIKNNNMQGVSNITARFSEVPAIDLLTELNLAVLSIPVTPVNAGGMWVITPNEQPTDGSYNITASIENFNDLADNGFELVKRPEQGSPLDWGLSGAVKPLINTTGTRVSDGFTYLQGLTSFSEFAIRETGEGASSLPIELIALAAGPEEDKIKVTWTTAVEINNEMFSVERSEDGVEFITVATVAGAGNSSIEKDYVAYDSNPLLGTSFYRLKQTDTDGAFKYSDMLAVTITNNIKSDFSLIPNPNTGRFKVVLTTLFKTASIQVLNNFGQMVYVDEITNISGKATMDIDMTEIAPAGIYFVKVDIGKDTFIKQLVLE